MIRFIRNRTFRGNRAGPAGHPSSRQFFAYYTAGQQIPLSYWFYITDSLHTGTNCFWKPAAGGKLQTVNQVHMHGVRDYRNRLYTWDFPGASPGESWEVNDERD